ncbi:Uncharacterised protein [Bordetella pertussis]|nr:Uncharacterised protein [Bordetella pertussis]
MVVRRLVSWIFSCCTREASSWTRRSVMSRATCMRTRRPSVQASMRWCTSNQRCTEGANTSTDSSVKRPRRPASSSSWPPVWAPNTRR